MTDSHYHRDLLANHKANDELYGVNNNQTA